MLGTFCTIEEDLLVSGIPLAAGMKGGWVRYYGICQAQIQNLHQNIAIHQLKGNMKTVGQEVRRKQHSTEWSKLEDKQLADPISHLIAKGDSCGGEVTHCFGLDDPARRMTCIAISTSRVTRPRTNSEFTPEHCNTPTQREHEDCGAGGKEETKWSKLEDNNLPTLSAT
jgi:hypothetical protein